MDDKMRARTLFYLIFINLLIIVLLTGCQTGNSPATAIAITPPIPQDELQEKALEFIGLLAEGDYSTAVEWFNDLMKEQAGSANSLGSVWSNLIMQVGAYQGPLSLRTSEEASYDIVNVTTQFENSQLDIKIVFDDQGKVAGMWFNPAGEQAAYSLPAYADSESYTDREVTIGDGEWALPGTLSLPVGEGPFPAVVLVHGSGPNDRDETIGANKPFQDLAAGLATRGIAVLRYEKRTRQYPEKIMALGEQFTAKEEAIDDALIAVNTLRNTPGVDAQRIYLLGHSMGGMLAPRIAAQDPGIAGLIVLAGPTRPLEDLILEQQKYLANLDGTISPEEQSEIERTEQMVARVKDLATLTASKAADLPLGIPAPYWLDLHGYKPADSASQLAMPLFALQGERDYQVTLEDLEGWRAALAGREDVFLKSYPGLNHLFMSGQGKASPSDYLKANHVAQEVIEDITSFIEQGTVKTKPKLFGGIMNTNQITQLMLLVVPLLLLQAGLCLYALSDLIKRKQTRGPRWLWFVLLILTLFAVPTGLIVSAIYLAWARKEEYDDEYDEYIDDTN
jgi:uncharacterized protein